MNIELENINVSECPDCKAKVAQFRKENQHTNGKWNEFVIFECGYKLYFSPNIMQLKQIGICERSKSYMKQFKSRTESLSSLRQFIISLECDKNFKLQLQKALVNISLTREII